MNYLTKAVPLDLKSLSDAGTFSGYGSVFSTADKVKDIVEPGAFEKSLKAWDANGRTVPSLWQHQTYEPIGHYPDLKEDDHGLLIKEGELWIEDAPYARLAYKGMKTGAITGLSIGYRIKREEYDKKSGNNRLLELDLVEISVVTNPAHDDARIDGVKALIESGRLPSLKEFEEFLRDVGGFSRSQAKAIAGNGLTKLLDRCEADGEKGDETHAAVLAILSGAQSKLTR